MPKKTEKSSANRKGTRGAQGAGNIRQRKDGTWEARYTLGRDPGTGKQVQKSVYGKTQADVLQKLRKVQSDIDNGIFIEPTKITVGEWLDIWIDEYQNHVKESTKLEYKSNIKYRIKPAIGAVKLDKLTTPMIQKLYNDLGRAKGEKKGLSAKSIQNTHAILHRALKQALEIGYIRTNPSEVCKLPRKEKTEIQPLDDNEIALFLEEIKGDPLEIFYTVDLFTGMRQGEIVGLSWDCVDFEKGTIYIKQQIHRVGREYKLTSVKNDKPRTIMPAQFVMDLLLRQRSRQNEWKLKAGMLWRDPYNLVFTNEQGDHMFRSTVYQNFKIIASVIGKPYMRFHDLRHSYAVASLRAGDDIKTVQSNLGHHTAAFTLDVYGHVTDQMKQESASRMDRFIEGLGK